MNCEQVKGHLSAYLDDALSLEERQYVVTHVEDCLQCQSILADFAHFDALLAQLPRVSPGPGQRERFFASQEYQELVAAFGGDGKGENSLPKSMVHLVPYTPRRIFLPGGRQVHGVSTSLLALTKWPLYMPNLAGKKKKSFWGQRLSYGIVAAGVLLVLGAGGLVSWRRWQEKTSHTSNTGSPVTARP
jgi:hypothetical protein